MATNTLIERARALDADELLHLYFLVYGRSYPLALGTDRDVMLGIMSRPEHLWLVCRDTETKKIIASVVFQADPVNRIGKVEGLVVHPEFRMRNLALMLVSYGTTELFEKRNDINSIYATTRTLSIGPQRLMMKDGFIPLGIFPNAHRLKEQETLTLMAKFRPGVLERRKPLGQVPERLVPIVRALNEKLGITESPRPAPSHKIPADGADLEFELIFAPEYVKRQFEQRFTDPYDRFYPFHTPNFLMASKDGFVELYAYLNRQDGYCTIISSTQSLSTLTGRVGPLLQRLRDFGVSYIETLTDLQHVDALESLFDARFIPSAIYPAIQEVEGELHDFVLMTRTLEPLNFRGLNIDRAFKPYIEQYIDLWKQMHLDVLEVFNE